MSEQLVLSTELTEFTLADEATVKPGDIVRVDYWGQNTSFIKVVLVDGSVCLKQHYMYGENVPISNMIKNGGEVTKTTMKNIYVECKKRGWNFGYWAKRLAE